MPHTESADIYAALCGGNNSERARAEALDVSDFSAIHDNWRKAGIADIERWLKAPPCSTDNKNVLARSDQRRKILRQGKSRLEQFSRIDAELKKSRDWKIAVVWPAQCTSCSNLLKAALAVIAAESQWPRPQRSREGQIGGWLDTQSAQRSLLAS